ncbi:uncharacterized protein LOC126896876 [Daktulosphaira vitifoliae]|uniref:uncharacterized protein LOC126896876 n=1 Tax=Daktulosphaira vitifoliae TaxID=58002 RepID=UPI0021AAAE29|nr:uncharacterized protein LOC126896876 [Daktulosphaira vitifoliae]
MNRKHFFLCSMIVIFKTVSGDFIRVMDRPNLAAGKYKLVFKAVFPCNRNNTYPINLNWYLSKVTATKTVLRGNTTAYIGFDENIYFNINMAIWSKIGGWVDNAFVYQNKDACSTLKMFMGKVWNDFCTKGNFKGCPILPGIYIMDGFDLSLIEQSNFPKEFFYGTYKFKLFYTNKNNETVGCLYLVMDIKRPWE